MHTEISDCPFLEADIPLPILARFKNMFCTKMKKQPTEMSTNNSHRKVLSLTLSSGEMVSHCLWRTGW